MTLFDPDDYYLRAFDSWQPENMVPYLGEDLVSDDDLQDWYHSTDGRLGFNGSDPAAKERGVS